MNSPIPLFASFFGVDRAAAESLAASEDAFDQRQIGRRDREQIRSDVRILLTADIHYNSTCFAWLSEQALTFDLIAIAGDPLNIFIEYLYRY